MTHNGAMGWLHKIFGTANGREAAMSGGPATSQFHESETTSNEEETTSRNAPRRELVQVILRDTMRQHGIPSDWIECRILSTVNRSGRAGMHVNFVVKQAHDKLLHYVFAFQDTFERELARFEPRSSEWMFSLGWEFQGHKADAKAMPEPGSWSLGAGGTAGAPGAGKAGLEGGLAFAPTADPLLEVARKSDEDVQRDLQALFAIRDAALADAARKPAPENDFENTQPFMDSGESKPPR